MSQRVIQLVVNKVLDYIITKRTEIAYAKKVRESSIRIYLMLKRYIRRHAFRVNKNKIKNSFITVSSLIVTSEA